MAGLLEKLLARTVSFLGGAGVDYMVVGGYALPSYGAIRTTLDLDIAVRIESETEFESFVDKAKKFEFQVSIASFSDPMSVFRDVETGLEVEFWFRPDGVKWDRETLRRRRKAEIGGVKLWLISPEDFIVNKLSRADRGVQDEKDVKGILTRLGESLDRRYLDRRAKQARVLALLRAVERVA